ncbi:hypothetical protein [Rhodoplanes sp. SY1]|uniref:hypothetical protein n=1 Tax=Rhodoplanes sp. SY1 TaxID=3166646 RepID=UPI0038B48BA2
MTSRPAPGAGLAPFRILHSEVTTMPPRPRKRSSNDDHDRQSHEGVTSYLARRAAWSEQRRIEAEAREAERAEAKRRRAESEARIRALHES